MRCVVTIACVLFSSSPAWSQPPDSLPRGAMPSPAAKVAAAKSFPAMLGVPKEFAVIPPRLSAWLNDQTGICVTSEEAFAKGWWSVRCGLPQLFIPDAEVGRWARKYGFYNGAMLTDVMDVMAADGFSVDGGNFKDGPYYKVDYTASLPLQTALVEGVVKLGIDSNQLPSTAGGRPGWFKFGGGRFSGVDHAVGLAGYGSAQFCFDSLKVPLPAGVDPAKPDCFLMFTWGTIGVVDLPWLRSACREAWVRIPTTPGQAPPPTPEPPPAPPAPPAPGPMPNGWVEWVRLILAILAGLFGYPVGSKAVRLFRRS